MSHGERGEKLGRQLALVHDGLVGQRTQVELGQSFAARRGAIFARQLRATARENAREKGALCHRREGVSG